MLVAMVTRVTRSICSEIATAPAAMQWLLLASVALWLAAFCVWAARNGPIYLASRSDDKPG